MNADQIFPPGKFALPTLYPITDRRLSNLSHAEQVARLARGGARLVQLREKELPPRDFYAAAEAALKVARSLNVRLIINDRADIALALGTDGVHLGQDDLPPRAARELLGPRAVIGHSTHNAEQAAEASRLPIDYLAFGPVFPTTSKSNPDPVVGLENLRRVRALIGNLPLVAIGGITHENAREVIAAGADSVAVIAALLSDPDLISQKTSALSMETGLT